MTTGSNQVLELFKGQLTRYRAPVACQDWYLITTYPHFFRQGRSEFLIEFPVEFTGNLEIDDLRKVHESCANASILQQCCHEPAAENLPSAYNFIDKARAFANAVGGGQIQPQLPAFLTCSQG